MFPRAEVAAVVTEHGVRGVYLSLFDPTKGRDGDWVGVVFTPAEICRLLVAAQAKAELAEAPVGWVGCEPARVAA